MIYTFPFKLPLEQRISDVLRVADKLVLSVWVIHSTEPGRTEQKLVSPHGVANEKGRVLWPTIDERRLKGERIKGQLAFLGGEFASESEASAKWQEVVALQGSL